MSDFKLSRETTNTVNKKFRSRDRRLIAHELLQYDHYPALDEREDMAAKYETSLETVRRVIVTLQKMSLFTEKEGSMPLYKRTLQNEQRSKTPQPHKDPATPPTTDPPASTQQDEETPENPPKDNLEGAASEEPELAPTYRDVVDRFKSQYEGLGTRVTSMEESLDEISSQINRLVSSQTRQNPAKVVQVAQNPPKQVVQAKIAQVETAEVEDDAELIIPSMDLEQENPLDNLSDTVVELEGSVIATKRVGFTPKSLMLHDLARQKGFQGNFADFVNASIYSAFKGRSFKLVVEETV